MPAATNLSVIMKCGSTRGTNYRRLHYSGAEFYSLGGLWELFQFKLHEGVDVRSWLTVKPRLELQWVVQ